MDKDIGELLMTFIDANLSTVTEDDVPIRKLFIGNLAQRTTYKDLFKLFSKYGNVECCFLRRNHNKSNYAFVTLDNVHAAARAIRDAIRLHNSNLRVMPAHSWHQPDSIEKQYYNMKEWQKLDEKQSNEQCNEDYVENDITSSSIQTLNDECLMHIFLQLPIIYRIRMERVCKRWRAVSQESWRSVKKLDLSYSTWGYPPCSRKTEITTTTLRKVLLRCGRFLNEIDFSCLHCQIGQITLTVVGKLCPNLQKINVTGLHVSASGLNSLMNNCHNIRELTIGWTSYTCDTDLKGLFKINQKLRYFKIVSGKICGMCLSHLPLATMEEIVLSDLYDSIHEPCLSQAIAKLQNLKSLRINRCTDVSDEVIQAIGTYCTNLKRLQLTGISPLIQSKDMIPITQLTILKALNVSKNLAVTDEFLCELASKCQQLGYLDITECWSVTNVGAAAVATLPKLEVLIMNYLNLVEDPNLKDMNSLKILQCHKCQIADKTAIELIESAPQLQVLDLSRCLITNLTLRAAAAVTDKRTNNTMLRIFVGGTGVSMNTFEIVSPFLQILNVNYSHCSFTNLEPIYLEENYYKITPI